MPDEGFGAGPEIAETHVSTVAFVGDRAYKFLKPVATSFLDHRSVEQRLAAVDVELELNRRCAPDVYLGTADVVERGEVVDRALVMRRLPASTKFARLLSDGTADEEIPKAARAIAALHASLPAETGVRAAGATLEGMSDLWQSHHDDIAPWVGEVIDPDAHARLTTLVSEALTHQGHQFAARIEAGWVRDGHGDLRAEDIFCLEDGPRLIDCLAFDEHLRICDVISDLAFLVMDVHRLSGPAAARRLAAAYHEFTNEQHPPSLMHHYVAYRAYVRCKIACLRHEAGAEGASRLARELHTLALDHLDRARIRAVLVGGAPGTGKTTLSGHICDRTDWIHLSTDDTRKQLADLPLTADGAADLDAGLYGPAARSATYAELVRRAEGVITSGRSVVLDASWADAGERSAAVARLKRLGAEIVEIECRLDDAEADRRMAERHERAADSSDAHPGVVAELRNRRDEWSEAIPVDTSGAASPGRERRTLAILGALSGREVEGARAVVAPFEDADRVLVALLLGGVTGSREGPFTIESRFLVAATDRLAMWAGEAGREESS